MAHNEVIQKNIVLNDYCLRHIFEYLLPEHWSKFIEVCEDWKSAAYSIDFRELRYIRVVAASRIAAAEIRRLEFEEVLNIVKIILPKMKRVNLHLEDITEEISADFYIRIGRFEYVATMTESQNIEIVKAVLDASKIEDIKLQNVGICESELQKFFNKNLSLKHLDVTLTTPEDHQKFFNMHISSVRSNQLEKVSLVGAVLSDVSVDEQRNIIKLLQKQKLKQLKLQVKNEILTPLIEEVRRHEKTLMDLTFIHGAMVSPINAVEDTSKLLPIIPHLKNLATLNLKGFILSEEFCREIAKKLAITCLKIANCALSSNKCLSFLLNMRSLEELEMFNLELFREIRNLKKLTVMEPFTVSRQTANVAKLLSKMPNVSSFSTNDETRVTKSGAFTKESAKEIKKILGMRGLNIVFYLERLILGDFILEKVGTVETDPLSDREFSIVLFPIGDPYDYKMTLSMFEN